MIIHAMTNMGIPGPSTIPFFRCHGNVQSMLVRTSAAAVRPSTLLVIEKPSSSQHTEKIAGRYIGTSSSFFIFSFIIITDATIPAAHPKNIQVLLLKASAPSGVIESA